jgi:hypothetical protein
VVKSSAGLVFEVSSASELVVILLLCTPGSAGSTNSTTVTSSSFRQQKYLLHLKLLQVYPVKSFYGLLKWGYDD